MKRNTSFLYIFLDPSRILDPKSHKKIQSSKSTCWLACVNNNDSMRTRSNYPCAVQPFSVYTVCIIWMRSSREWLLVRARLTASAKDATVLGSIPASSDKVESEGRQVNFRPKWLLKKYMYNSVDCTNSTQIQ